MKKIKSTVSFFRKSLKRKGKSQHNGRGVWEMDVELEDDESLKDVVEKMIIKLGDKVLVERKDNGDIIVVLKQELCASEYYRTFYYVNKYEVAGCLF